MKSHCKEGHERTPENLYPNRTCKQCACRKAKNWNESNPDKRKKNLRVSLLKTRYKLTEEKYNKILEIQSGVCAICKRPPFPGRLLIVDHAHACCSGQESCGKCVRGLIHQSCNVALGAFQDNPIICRNAAEYLENSPVRRLLN